MQATNERSEFEATGEENMTTPRSAEDAPMLVEGRNEAGTGRDNSPRSGRLFKAMWTVTRDTTTPGQRNAESGNNQRRSDDTEELHARMKDLVQTGMWGQLVTMVMTAGMLIAMYMWLTGTAVKDRAASEPQCPTALCGQFWAALQKSELKVEDLTIWTTNDDGTGCACRQGSAYSWAAGGRARRDLLHMVRGFRDYCRVIQDSIPLDTIRLSLPCMLWDLVVNLDRMDPRTRVSEDTAPDEEDTGGGKAAAGPRGARGGTRVLPEETEKDDARKQRERKGKEGNNHFDSTKAPRMCWLQMSMEGKPTLECNRAPWYKANPNVCVGAVRSELYICTEIPWISRDGDAEKVRWYSEIDESNISVNKTTSALDTWATTWWLRGGRASGAQRPREVGTTPPLHYEPSRRPGEKQEPAKDQGRGP